MEEPGCGLFRSAELVGDASWRTDLHGWLTHTIRPLFDRRVLQVSEDILVARRLLVEDARKSGHTYSQPGLIIAATVLHHGLTVVSRNTRQYRRTQTPVSNPWTDSSPAALE